MKLKNIVLPGVFILILSACSTTSKPTITTFEECVAAGNPVMESYPRQCKAGDQTFTEQLAPTDSQLPSGQKACTKEFVPVCGEIPVDCMTQPCPPLKITFQNKCEAENAKAMNIVEGECMEAPNPQGACLSFDGNWLEATKECEGMGKEMCDNLGGAYNECASACRNNPDAEMCTMQCVQVCQF